MATASRKGRTHPRRVFGAAAALAICPVLAMSLVACGGGSASGDSGSGDSGANATQDAPSDAASTPPIVDALDKAPKDEGGDKALGTVTLNLGGVTTKSPVEACDIVETVELDFALSAGDLNVLLPPKPGPIKDGDRPASVRLPIPADGLPYAVSIHPHGQRTESGERTTGHIEGTAHQVASSTEVPYVIDFDCKLQRISS